jgi:hypothetical protein
MKTLFALTAQELLPIALAIAVCLVPLVPYLKG